MRIFTVANLKGGVGKTTTAIALAGLLAERGFRTLLIDLDPQASATAYFGRLPEECNSGSQLWFQEGGTPRVEVACPELTLLGGRLALLPTAPTLARAERMVAQPGGLGGVVKKHLLKLSGEYHYAVIDSPPALGVLLINAIAACERLVVPVQCEPLAIEGLRRLDSTLAMMRRSRGSVVDRLIAPTMVDFRNRASPAALEELRRGWSGELWESFVPEDTALRDAARRHLPPSVYAPRSRAVLAYRQLLADLLQAKAAPSTAETAWHNESPVL